MEQFASTRKGKRGKAGQIGLQNHCRVRKLWRANENPDKFARVLVVSSVDDRRALQMFDAFTRPAE